MQNFNDSSDQAINMAIHKLTGGTSGDVPSLAECQNVDVVGSRLARNSTFQVGNKEDVLIQFLNNPTNPDYTYVVMKKPTSYDDERVASMYESYFDAQGVSEAQLIGFLPFKESGKMYASSDPKFASTYDKGVAVTSMFEVSSSVVDAGSTALAGTHAVAVLNTLPLDLSPDTSTLQGLAGTDQPFYMEGAITSKMKGVLFGGTKLRYFTGRSVIHQDTVKVFSERTVVPTSDYYGNVLFDLSKVMPYYRSQVRVGGEFYSSSVYEDDVDCLQKISIFIDWAYNDNGVMKVASDKAFSSYALKASAGEDVLQVLNFSGLCTPPNMQTDDGKEVIPMQILGLRVAVVGGPSYMEIQSKLTVEFFDSESDMTRNSAMYHVTNYEGPLRVRHLVSFNVVPDGSTLPSDRSKTLGRPSQLTLARADSMVSSANMGASGYVGSEKYVEELIGTMRNRNSMLRQTLNNSALNPDTSPHGLSSEEEGQFQENHGFSAKPHWGKIMKSVGGAALTGAKVYSTMQAGSRFDGASRFESGSRFTGSKWGASRHSSGADADSQPRLENPERPATKEERIRAKIKHWKVRYTDPEGYFLSEGSDFMVVIPKAYTGDNASRRFLNQALDGGYFVHDHQENLLILGRKKESKVDLVALVWFWSIFDKDERLGRTSRPFVSSRLNGRTTSGWGNDALKEIGGLMEGPFLAQRGEAHNSRPVVVMSAQASSYKPLTKEASRGGSVTSEEVRESKPNNHISKKKFSAETTPEEEEETEKLLKKVKLVEEVEPGEEVGKKEAKFLTTRVEGPVEGVEGVERDLNLLLLSKLQEEERPLEPHQVKLAMDSRENEIREPTRLGSLGRVVGLSESDCSYLRREMDQRSISSVVSGKVLFFFCAPGMERFSEISLSRFEKKLTILGDFLSSETIVAGETRLRVFRGKDQQLLVADVLAHLLPVATCPPFNTVPLELLLADNNRIETCSLCEVSKETLTFVDTFKFNQLLSGANLRSPLVEPTDALSSGSSSFVGGITFGKRQKTKIANCIGDLKLLGCHTVTVSSLTKQEIFFIRFSDLTQISESELLALHVALRKTEKGENFLIFPDGRGWTSYDTTVSPLDVWTRVMSLNVDQQSPISGMFKAIIPRRSSISPFFQHAHENDVKLFIKVFKTDAMQGIVIDTSRSVAGPLARNTDFESYPRRPVYKASVYDHRERERSDRVAGRVLPMLLVGGRNRIPLNQRQELAGELNASDPNGEVYDQLAATGRIPDSLGGQRFEELLKRYGKKVILRAKASSRMIETLDFDIGDDDEDEEGIQRILEEDDTDLANMAPPRIPNQFSVDPISIYAGRDRDSDQELFDNTTELSLKNPGQDLDLYSAGFLGVNPNISSTIPGWVNGKKGYSVLNHCQCVVVPDCDGVETPVVAATLTASVTPFAGDYQILDPEVSNNEYQVDNALNLDDEDMLTSLTRAVQYYEKTTPGHRQARRTYITMVTDNDIQMAPRCVSGNSMGLALVVALSGLPSLGVYTGCLMEDGTIGPVGDIQSKLEAFVHADLSLHFVMPAANLLTFKDLSENVSEVATSNAESIRSCDTNSLRGFSGNSAFVLPITSMGELAYLSSASSVVFPNARLQEEQARNLQSFNVFSAVYKARLYGRDEGQRGWIEVPDVVEALQMIVDTFDGENSFVKFHAIQYLQTVKQAKSEKKKTKKDDIEKYNLVKKMTAALRADFSNNKCNLVVKPEHQDRFGKTIDFRSLNLILGEDGETVRKEMREQVIEENIETFNINVSGSLVQREISTPTRAPYEPRVEQKKKANKKKSKGSGKPQRTSLFDISDLDFGV